jgi:hypothetical protein
MFGFVKHFLKATLPDLAASIADKRSFLESSAQALLEFRTGIVAETAVAAVLVVLVGVADIANVLLFTVVAMSTGVVIKTRGSGTMPEAMQLYLLGNSRRMLIQGISNGSNFKIVVQTVFNFYTGWKI